MAAIPDISRIENEDELESLINKTEDLGVRKQIRNRQKEIRDKRRAAYEAMKAANPKSEEDATTKRLRLAEAEKQRKLKEYQDRAKEQKEMSSSEAALRQKHQRQGEEKQRKLDQYKELAIVMSSTYNTGVADVLREKELIPDTPVKHIGVSPKANAGTSSALGGGTSYGAKKGEPESPIETPGGGKLSRNPSAVKEMLLEWCKKQCEGYQNVSITNFSSSWADGLAFCALIHHFCPNAFDFTKLTPNNRRANFTLAFSVAEKEAQIAPLLDVDDLMRMKNPDWKCVFTYIQGFYRRFGPQKSGPTSP